MTKQFKATWGEGYYDQGTKIITSDDISPDFGWDEDYIKRLNNAEVGEIVDCSDYSGILLVQRIS
jgi:hypothetical protein